MTMVTKVKSSKYPVLLEEHIVHNRGLLKNTKTKIINTNKYIITVSKKLDNTACILFKGTNLQKLAKIYGILYKQFSDFLDFNLYEEINSKTENLIFKTYQEFLTAIHKEMFTNVFNNLLTNLYKEYSENVN